MAIFVNGINRGTDGSPELDKGLNEELNNSFGKVHFILNSKDDCAGTLYITTSRLIWFSDTDPSTSYGLSYDKIVLHAISKDTALYKDSCVFIQLDDGCEERDENDEIPTLILAPEDPNEVDNIFDSLTTTSAFHDQYSDDCEDDEAEEDIEFDDEIENDVTTNDASQ